jgi:6-phosphogluconolactonase (cycloisomerase 2 family)
MLKSLVITAAVLTQTAFLQSYTIQSKPQYLLHNPDSTFGFVAGIDFHPDYKCFAATYFNNNKVIIYDLHENMNPTIRQIITKEKGHLFLPHGIAFHPQGNFLAVTQYGNHTIILYKWDKEKNMVIEKPLSVFTFPAELKVHNSHGIAFSANGDCLAITFCDCSEQDGFEEKIVLFPFDTKSGTVNPIPLSLVEKPKEKVGNPKGVTFSPDNKYMIATLCDSNQLIVYSVDNNYQLTAKQILNNPSAQLARPEDVKLSPDATHIAVTNTNSNTITIYYFDKDKGVIFPDHPVIILKNPESQLSYPHGIAFSPDGKYLGISHFGIHDGPQITVPLTREDKITLYRCDQ